MDKVIWTRNEQSKLGMVEQSIIQDDNTLVSRMTIIFEDKTIFDETLKLGLPLNDVEVTTEHPQVTQLFLVLYGKKQWMQDKIAVGKGIVVTNEDVKAVIARYNANQVVRTAKNQSQDKADAKAFREIQGKKKSLSAEELAVLAKLGL